MTRKQMDTLVALYPEGCDEVRYITMPDGARAIHAEGGPGQNAYGSLIHPGGGCIGISWEAIEEMADRALG
jgi:hypothetical protein